MSKINLNNITGGYAAVDLLNENFDAISAAMDNTLSRDGSTPNTWLANQDANHKRLLNVADPVDGKDAANKDFVLNAQVDAIQIAFDRAAYHVDRFTGDGSDTTFTLSVAPGIESNAQVYINGAYQNKNTFSVSGTTLTFTEAPPLGSSIEVFVVEPLQVATADAANVQYSPGSGGVQTTVEAKLRETVSVKDFGAVGDGVADDTAAFQSALDADNAVYVPEGTYLLSQRITISDKPITLYGSSVSECVLKWTNATGGIAVTNAGSNTNRYEISNLTFHTTQVSGGTALDIQVSTAIPDESVRITDVNIQGADKSTQYWTIGIKTSNAVGSMYNNVYITGQEGVATNVNTKGILVTHSTGAYAMVQNLTNVIIKFCEIGLNVVDTGSISTEGVTCQGCLIVQCNQCVVVDATGTTGGYKPPYWAFIGCQFDAYAKECIFIENGAQVFITNCVIYGDSTSSTYPLVNLASVNTAYVSNCLFIDFQSSPYQRTGLYLSGDTSATIVSQCGFSFLSQGISIASTAVSNWIDPYCNFGQVTTPIADSGINSRVASNANRAFILGSASGGGNVRILTEGADTNINLDFNPKGVGLARAINYTTGNYAGLSSDGGVEIYNNGGQPYIDFKYTNADDFDARIQLNPAGGKGLRFVVNGPSSPIFPMSFDGSGNIIVAPPTSPSGLPTGAIWNDGGTLKVV